MALGKRKAHQQQLMVPTTALPKSPGHPFYDALNRLLAEAKFDAHVEGLCESHYASRKGRPSIPPGTYFRMLLVGYFEGIDSQRGIAWRCKDSLSLRSFLGIEVTKASPDHSSLTVIRKRLPIEIHQEVFRFVLSLADGKGLVKGKTVAVDATTLEANAAMKSIVRRDTAEGWNDYVRRLAEEAGIENPTDEEARRFDRRRKKKKVSNDDWKSPSDPDSRITKMKDGRTHLAYKAEHAIDLDSEIILSATVQHANVGDTESVKSTVNEAQVMLLASECEQDIEEIVADKGYHKAETLAWLQAQDIRTYVPERKTNGRRRWTDKPEDWKQAVIGNRRRVGRERGKKLQRLRSERVERSFAHVCETGGGRRSWIRGITEVSKRYLIQTAAHNLGLVMRAMCGAGKPRAWANAATLMMALVFTVLIYAGGPISIVMATTIMLLLLHSQLHRRPSVIKRPMVALI